MKWLCLMALASIVGCSDSHCDCGGDAGMKDVISPVSSGQTCSVEGAKTEGYDPACGGGVTICTCTAGKWDCNNCPDATSD
jgi:hypothetical protein